MFVEGKSEREVEKHGVIVIYLMNNTIYLMLITSSGEHRRGICNCWRKSFVDLEILRNNIRGREEQLLIQEIERKATSVGKKLTK